MRKISCIILLVGALFAIGCSDTIDSRFYVKKSLATVIPTPVPYTPTVKPTREPLIAASGGNSQSEAAAAPTEPVSIEEEADLSSQEAAVQEVPSATPTFSAMELTREAPPPSLTPTLEATPLPTETPVPSATPTKTPAPAPTATPPTPAPTATFVPPASPTPDPAPEGYPYPGQDQANGPNPPISNAQSAALTLDEPSQNDILNQLVLIDSNGPLDPATVGIQIHLHAEDASAILDQLEELNVGWVKLQVTWKTFQPEQNRFDENWFWELDDFIHRANGRDIQVMLSIAKAPEWSRPTTTEDGPPNDFNQFRSFMRKLAERYGSDVAAYELWNEPNLKREWNGMPLDASMFVELIAAGAAGIREVDPNAVIISGAPATTGINDGVNAVDDRVYFEQMLQAGVAQHVDGIGIHPYGWANPPLSTLNQPAPNVTSHNDHHSFYFSHSLADYITLMGRYGVSKQLWITEFGWGSFEAFEKEPPPEAVFMKQVSEAQQADYIESALQMAHQSDWVGPVILWNLNFGPLLGNQFSESGYSIIRPDGTPRPAYDRIESLLDNN